MKLQNIEVGDLIEAKESVTASNCLEINEGGICRVLFVEPESYCGLLSIEVKINGRKGWTNHKLFRKLPTQAEHVNIEKVEEPKKLSQSLFDDMEDKWKFAAVDKNGNVWLYSDKPFIRFDTQWMQSGDTPYRTHVIADATDWQNSLIKREFAELKGSDLTRKMLEDGETGILCYVDDDNDERAIDDQMIAVVKKFEDNWFHTTRGTPWRYAVPTQAKVEPLSRWIHRNTNIYTVTDIANKDSEDKEKYPTTIVYKCYDGKVWSKPLSDWYRSMTKIKE